MGVLISDDSLTVGQAEEVSGLVTGRRYRLQRPGDMLFYELVGWTGQGDKRSGETLLAGRVLLDCAA